MLHAVGRTEFDHAVVMVRDRLDALAHFERQGFHLSDKAVHNLGSCNRLIVLEGTYIELLGCPAPPARARKSPIRRLGWKPWSSAHTTPKPPTSGCAPPALPSIRCRNSAVPLCWTDVKSPRASIPCASPSSPARHPHVFLSSPDARMRLVAGVDVPPQWRAQPAAHRCPRGRRPCRRATPGAGRRRDRASWQATAADVPLANLRIHVSEDPQAAQPTLSALTLENRDGAHYALDTGL